MSLSDLLRQAADRLDALESTGTGLPAYKLLKDLPGLPRGTVFIWDAKDAVKGSAGYGCLKNAWDHGNCQANWVAGTHVFPGQEHRNTDWFEPISNPGRFTA